MNYDDIVIGSGLSALGAVLGLDAARRVLVLGSPAQGEYSHYSAARSVPCAYLGSGGLGNDWHGVIPLGLRNDFGTADPGAFAALFRRFYPATDIEPLLGRPLLFVPWRPIRPATEFARLSQARAGRLEFNAALALRFAPAHGNVEVETTDGTRHRATRLWIGAGPLHTPGLLERSLGSGFARGLVSDHALCYVGLTQQHSLARIGRGRDGLLFPAHYGPGDAGLYTARPARFAFSRLDFGIEQRAVFGMPTGNAIAKIVRRMSPGLIAEALFNRAGAFPHARSYSIYCQSAVEDAYVLGTGSLPLEPRTATIAAATAAARAHAPIAGIQPSLRNDLYIPGIHLHHSVDTAKLAASGLDRADSPIQIIDASALAGIGPEHHSFKLMLRAQLRARNL